MQNQTISQDLVKSVADTLRIEESAAASMLEAAARSSAVTSARAEVLRLVSLYWPERSSLVSRSIAGDPKGSTRRRQRTKREDMSPEQLAESDRRRVLYEERKAKAKAKA